MVTHRCDHCEYVTARESNLLRHKKWLHWAVLGEVRARDR
jgi:hypothetical protein